MTKLRCSPMSDKHPMHTACAFIVLWLMAIAPPTLLGLEVLFRFKVDGVFYAGAALFALGAGGLLIWASDRVMG